MWDTNLSRHVSSFHTNSLDNPYKKEFHLNQKPTYFIIFILYIFRKNYET